MKGCCIAIVVKYISSVQNQMGTLLSSPCQLRLGVDLSHLGWSLTLSQLKSDLPQIRFLVYGIQFEANVIVC